MLAIRIIFTAILIGWLAVSHQIKAAVSTTAARNLDVALVSMSLKMNAA